MGAVDENQRLPTGRPDSNKEKRGEGKTGEKKDPKEQKIPKKRKEIKKEEED